MTFVYVKYKNLYLMACTKRNANATLLVLFLYRLLEVTLPLLVLSNVTRMMMSKR